MVVSFEAEGGRRATFFEIPLFAASVTFLTTASPIDQFPTHHQHNFDVSTPHQMPPISPKKSTSLKPPLLKAGGPGLVRQESSALLIADSVYEDSLSDSDNERHSPRGVDLDSVQKPQNGTSGGISRKQQSQDNNNGKEESVDEIMIPNEYKDPITGFIMLKPVQTTHGQIYEYDTIDTWLQNNDTDPITKALMTDKKLSTAKVLKGKIETFLEKHPAIIRDQTLFVLPKTLLDELVLILGRNTVEKKTSEQLNATFGKFMDAFVQPNTHNKQNIMHMLAEHSSFDIYQYVTKQLMSRNRVWVSLIPELLFQRDHNQQTPLHLAFATSDYRILLYMLSYLNSAQLKRAIVMLAGKKAKKAPLQEYIKKASEAQYQNLITDIIRLDSSEEDLERRKIFYREKKLQIGSENMRLKSIQDIVAQLK